MPTETTQIPKKFHDAVERWRDRFIPDYPILVENWDQHFPKEPPFQLCAYREQGMCGEIECGDRKGQPKFTKASQMEPEQAGHLLAAIRAQASTEFGSIQQHQLTLTRAQNEEDQFWILRMMTEELRHGYQMLHLLLEDDWSIATNESSANMVEEILSMRTGSHVLGAFNIDFDSFVDNIVFCGLIDRVGKYQLAMQKVSAYKPMAESMPQMLREEAFHLATGVVPMRRWVQEAARGEIFVTMELLQKTLNKWVPRALEMFGDERGGQTNVSYGLKPMANAQAQQQYYDEIQKVVDDLNMRYVRAKLPELGFGEAQAVVHRLLEGGENVQGIAPEELLRLPHREFFRRRGVPSFSMVGFAGEPFTDVDEYIGHLLAHLPEGYRAGRDFKGYVDLLREVHAGTTTIKEAQMKTPNLRRVGGNCPCSKSVRWVVDDPAAVLPATA